MSWLRRHLVYPFPVGGVKPRWRKAEWQGPVGNWAWRLAMAWKALRGYELNGFEADE